MNTNKKLPALMVLIAMSAYAQQAKKGIIAEGGAPDDRGSARVLYWNRDTNSSAGWFAVNYGRPVWRKIYEDPVTFDGMTKGKVWRMGSNYWTVLDTSLPLKISGKDVAVGTYFLGLRRSADGSTWNLVFIDPTQMRRTRLDAFEIEKAPVLFETPMGVEQAVATAERLTIAMSYTKEDSKNVTMKVAWGNLALAAPIKVTVSE